MTDKLTRLVLHPFFAATYPILFLLSGNISQISPTQAVRPLLISLSVAVFLTVLLGLSAKDFRQGGLSAFIILMLFFTYGHVHYWLERNAPLFASHLFLGIAWLFLLVLGLTLKYRIRDLGAVTRYLNVVMAVLLIQPIINIGAFTLRSGIPAEIAPPSPFENIEPNPHAAEDLPDIYYIILDAYGTSDVMQELFGYDNSPFIQRLEERGFYVADQSRSNYIQTALSLSSSLNLDYLGNIEGVRSEDRDPLAEMIRHSKVREFLEEQGYQTVTFATAYGPTLITDSDVFIPYRVSLINDLEGLVFSTSALRALNDHTQNLFLPFLCEVQRGGILNIFENLKKVPSLPGPKFVFVHIPAPHPPFVFDADGEATQHGDCNGLDGSLFNGSREDYLAGYPRQVEYISKMTEEVVDILLAESAIPPIIILQGDHGSGLLLDWESHENSCLRERTAILNAYYIPGLQEEELYETITPVNSFRVVLNTTFSLQLPLLADRIYYSPWDAPYQFVDITQKIEPACTTHK